MFWLSHPPYLRWALAGLIVVLSLWADLRPTATVDHPFAAADLPAGTALAEAALETRAVPAGMLDSVATTGVLHRDVPAGEPILASDVAAPSAPEGWWALALDLPAGTSPGMRLRLVTGEGALVGGLVVEVTAPQPFDRDVRGLVAVPGEDVTRVATAARTGALAIAVDAP